MHFPYEVKVPKSTSQTAPYEMILLLSAGVITAVHISIPAGHAGTAHLQLLFHEFQMYPLSRGQDYHGDKDDIPIFDRFDMETGPYELKARGWNDDPDNDHRFQVHIEVMLPDQIGMSTGVQGLQQVKDLAGSSLEV